MSSLSDIITRKYSNFRGVDFTNGIVQNFRSPFSINMWKNYKEDDCIQTRPGMTLLNSFNGEIYGLFFFVKNNISHVLVHVGTKLLKWTNYPSVPAETNELYTSMNPRKSRHFVFDTTLFIMDGINYLEFDGNAVKEVVGTIPYTSYYKNPDGSTSIDEDTDIDLINQPINVLTSLRKNLFVADGVSKDYQLDDINLDSASKYLMKALINGIEKTENIDFSVNRTNGVVTFNSIPESGNRIEITYSKTIAGHKERILNCLLSCEFDNRFFFSGNPDYPNSVFHCELNDPRYIRDNAIYNCGLDLANIKALIPGNNVLWVIKDIIQNSSSLYYLTPTLDSTYDKIYPSVNGSVSLGCVSKGINFNDDIVFFSNKGLEGIANSSLYSEQILEHRSSMVDSKLLNESNYKDIELAEYDGYLLCLIDSHIYLADSRKLHQAESNDTEYEWFYWELPYSINFIKEYRGELFLGNKDGQLFKLDGTTDNEADIYSVWTTKKDDFNYQGYTKTTNKRGNVANLKVMNNDEIKLDTIVDGEVKEKGVYSDKKGYIQYRIKDKKFKEIQLRFSSNKPFGLFSCTIEGFIAGYIKR